MNRQRLAGKQRGITLIGFLFICVSIGFAALVVMRLFPLYNESFKVRAALESVAKAPDIAEKSPREIESSLLKHFQIDDIDRFDSRNIREYLVIKPDSDRRTRTMSMNYEARSNLFGNLDVVLKFDESRTIAGIASE